MLSPSDDRPPREPPESAPPKRPLAGKKTPAAAKNSKPSKPSKKPRVDATAAPPPPLSRTTLRVVREEVVVELDHLDVIERKDTLCQLLRQRRDAKADEKRLKAQKKAIRTELDDRIAEASEKVRRLDEEIDQMEEVVHAERETRILDCEENLVPSQRIVEVVLRSTGEILKVRPALENDLQMVFPLDAPAKARGVVVDGEE